MPSVNDDTQTQDMVRELVSAATADLHVPAGFAERLLRRRRRARIIRFTVPLTVAVVMIAFVAVLAGSGTHDRSQIIPAQPTPTPACVPSDVGPMTVPKQTPNGPLSTALANRLTRELPGFRLISASDVASACDATIQLTNTPQDLIVVSVQPLTRTFSAAAYAATNGYRLSTLADRSQLLTSEAQQTKGGSRACRTPRSPIMYIKSPD